MVIIKVKVRKELAEIIKRINHKKVITIKDINLAERLYYKNKNILKYLR